MKDIVKGYLDKYFSFWREEFGSLPKIPFDEDLQTIMYTGESDEEEYIEWMYQPNNTKHNFNSIEDKFQLKLHHQLKEFFESYYFLELQGFLDNRLINIDGIFEGRDIIGELEFTLEENENMGMIQIGIISPEDLPICFENKSGQIYIVDVENNKKDLLVNSLEEMFTKMNPKK